jgi:hypothetical protein
MNDVRLRAATRAIFDACYPSEDWSPVGFEEAESFGAIHYQQACGSRSLECYNACYRSGRTVLLQVRLSA